MSTPVTRSAAEARAALARASVSQTALAAATSRSQAYWSRRLTGQTALDMDDLAAISEITGTSVIELVRGSAA